MNREEDAWILKETPHQKLIKELNCEYDNIFVLSICTYDFVSSFELMKQFLFCIRC